MISHMMHDRAWQNSSVFNLWFGISSCFTLRNSETFSPLALIQTLFTTHVISQIPHPCHWTPPLSSGLSTGGVQNGTNLRGYRLLFGPAWQPLLMPRRCSLSRTFNSFVWRSAKIHSTVESRCHSFSSWGLYAFAFRWVFSIFQGKLRSIIEKSLFL